MKRREKTCGWKGVVLDIDLSSGEVVRRPLEQALRESYLGARGLNARCMYDLLEPGVDPFSEKNVMLFTTGPMCGTLAPGNARMSITAKTFEKMYLGMSNVGGKFGPELKFAGYDQIVLRGIAESPVYIWIDDGKVELRSAKDLWGKDTWETEERIKAELGRKDVQIGSIGPAGENLARYGCIIFNINRAAGETGLGAILGAKQVKAIAVQGTQPVEVADPAALVRVSKELVKRIKNNEFYSLIADYGTLPGTTFYDMMGYLAIRNYGQAGDWAAVQKIGAVEIAEYFKKPVACFCCPIHCSHHFKINEGRFKGEEGAKPEFSTTQVPFGACLGVDDPEALLKFLNVANRFGINTREFPYILSVAMDWYENGIITKADTDGIPLEWGNVDSVLKMLEKGAYREGFGDLIADGAESAARKIGKGAERFVSSVRGVQCGGEEVKVLIGTALNYVTATIPAHVEEGMPIVEIKGLDSREALEKFGTDDLDPLSYNKAAVTIYYQDLCMACDVLGICKFFTEWTGQEMSFKDLARLFEPCTGMEMDERSVRRISQRVRNLERAFLVREGITRSDDRMTGKVTEPIPAGQRVGLTLDEKKFSRLLDEYYESRGWDVETGIPLEKTLTEVGLEDVARDLRRRDKLPKEADRG
jgi:aldehyde:ferredoxin oxidoreductase